MTKNIKSQDIEYVVVGAGASGIYATQSLIEKGVQPKNIVLLESAPHVGGRAKSALHLIDAAAAESYPVITSSLLSPIRIRWEREWVSFSEVKWDSKEWIAFLPQWECLNSSLKALLLDIPSMDFEANPELTLNFKSPVSAIDQAEDGKWQLTTPQMIYNTQHVFWTAGLKSFQNACGGKHEAQKFLVSNQQYNSLAADYRGGIGLDLSIPKPIEWEEGFDQDAIIGLPLRFEGKFHLIIAVLEEDENSFLLKTLTHVHQDILSDPKLVGNFQKSLRRGIKTLIKGGEIPSESQEKWIVSDRVLGHRLGTPWLLNSQPDAQGLLFLGDESSASVSQDTLGALQSARTLTSDIHGEA